MMTSFSLVLANSIAVLATATGSCDHASAVGPFSMGLMLSNRVPSKASVARRFFATLKVAPAARILVRNSVTSETVIPMFRVTTTIDVLANTSASEATNSRFSVRSNTALRRWPGAFGPRRARLPSGCGEPHPVRLSTQAGTARFTGRSCNPWAFPSSARGPEPLSRLRLSRWRTCHLGQVRRSRSPACPPALRPAYLVQPFRLATSIFRPGPIVELIDAFCR